MAKKAKEGKKDLKSEILSYVKEFIKANFLIKIKEGVHNFKIKIKTFILMLLFMILGLTVAIIGVIQYVEKISGLPYGVVKIIAGLILIILALVINPKK